MGLRKKKDSLSTERTKITLGLRKKPMLMQSDNIINSVRKSSFKGNFRPINQPAPINRINPIKMPKTQGKLEVNIKITQLPNFVENIKNGWRRVYVNADGYLVQIKIRPKAWNKLLQANEEYSDWIATITGKIGARIKNGFELLEPAIQVYKNNKPTKN
ncbi:MAG TPA: hypothetical protein ENK59_01030 [Thioploca sp.]|nr:hypothetical protein [Thioploca sp.]